MKPLEFRSSKKVKLNSDKNDVIFQLIDWRCRDEDIEDDDSDSENEGFKDSPKQKYLITVYGIDSKGQSVSFDITGFTPYFYIKTS